MTELFGLLLVGMVHFGLIAAMVLVGVMVVYVMLYAAAASIDAWRGWRRRRRQRRDSMARRRVAERAESLYGAGDY